MLCKMPVILASASPRRQALLKNLIPEYQVIPANIAEDAPSGMPLEQQPAYLAQKKATHLAVQFPQALVIGCDTSVFLDGIILGKPKDADDARQMLTRLSGRTHKVITGCCLCLGQRQTRFHVATDVSFYPLSEAEILAYIATGEPFDKAGAYGLQGFGATLVKEIHGDCFNVIGLPLARLKREIEAFLAAEPC